MITVTVSDNVTPSLNRLAARLNSPAKAALVAATEVRGLLIAHYQKKNAEKHRNVFKKTNWWAKVARSVTRPHLEADGAVVSVTEPGVMAHYTGATIRPKNGKYLAIPARQEAAGKWPREFNNLYFVKFRNGTAALMAGAAKTGKKYAGRKGLGGKQDAGLIFYFLTKTSKLRADKTALPASADIDAAALRGINKYLEKTK
ncbi:MAG: hypothetical protein LBK76_10845 [Verrucomicrobiales bacterium]|jgi:hypothetical protein|nr:hypothetical protein [Verrucomicrobiales bacterium]